MNRAHLCNIYQHCHFCLWANSHKKGFWQWAGRIQSSSSWNSPQGKANPGTSTLLPWVLLAGASLNTAQMLSLDNSRWKNLDSPLQFLCQGLGPKFVPSTEKKPLPNSSWKRTVSRTRKDLYEHQTSTELCQLCKNRALSEAWAFHQTFGAQTSAPAQGGRAEPTPVLQKCRRELGACAVYLHTHRVNESSAVIRICSKSSGFGAFSGGLFSVDAKPACSRCRTRMGGSVAKGLWQQLLENTNVLLYELSLSLVPQIKIW